MLRIIFFIVINISYIFDIMKNVHDIIGIIFKRHIIPRHPKTVKIIKVEEYDHEMDLGIKRYIIHLLTKQPTDLLERLDIQNDLDWYFRLYSLDTFGLDGSPIYYGKLNLGTKSNSASIMYVYDV